LNRLQYFRERAALSQIIDAAPKLRLSGTTHFPKSLKG